MNFSMTHIVALAAAGTFAIVLVVGLPAPAQASYAPVQSGWWNNTGTHTSNPFWQHQYTQPQYYYYYPQYTTAHQQQYVWYYPTMPRTRQIQRPMRNTFLGDYFNTIHEWDAHMRTATPMWY